MALESRYEEGSPGEKAKAAELESSSTGTPILRFFFLLVPLLLLFLVLLGIAAGTFNEYYVHYRYIRLALIVVPIIAGFLATLFFSDKPFGSTHDWFMRIIRGQTHGAPAILWCCAAICTSLSAVLAWALVSTRTLHVTCNATAEMFTINSRGMSARLGVLPKDSVTTINVPPGTEQLLFVRDGENHWVGITPKSGDLIFAHRIDC